MLGSRSPQPWGVCRSSIPAAGPPAVAGPDGPGGLLGPGSTGTFQPAQVKSQRPCPGVRSRPHATSVPSRMLRVRQEHALLHPSLLALDRRCLSIFTLVREGQSQIARSPWWKVRAGILGPEQALHNNRSTSFLTGSPVVTLVNE